MDNSSLYTRRIFSALAVGLVVTAFSSHATAALFATTRYVKIEHAQHTAHVYNEEFDRLIDSPFNPGTSFELLPPEQTLWFLGAKVDIVKRNPDGSIDVVSDDPAYYQMNHHFTWLYFNPAREVTDPCGALMPLAAGSELTDFRLPSGYGFKMEGGFVSGGDWHWANPASVPHTEEVYLRFVMLMDDSPGGYRDVNVTWVDMLPCESEFAIPSGKSVRTGPVLTADRDTRIVAVFPHVHDHAKYIELRRNGETLRRFKPEYAEIPAAHDDVGEGETSVHEHNKHLPSEGLGIWTPGINGPIIQQGDELTAYGVYKNPHRRAIDNMTIFVVFWEPLNPLTNTDTRDDDAPQL